MIRRRSVYISIAIIAIDASFMEHTRMYVLHVRIATRTMINRVMWTRLLFADVNRMEIIFAERPPAESGEKILLANPIRSIQRANCVSRFATRTYIVRT